MPSIDIMQGIKCAGSKVLIFRSIGMLILGSVFFILGCSGGGGGSGTGSSGVTTTSNICTTNENGATNKLGVHRLMRFTITKSQNVTITATKTSGLSVSDPDLSLYKKGVRVGLAEGTAQGTETLTVGVTAGEYVLDVLEYNYTSASATPAITCFNISVTYSAGSKKPEQTVEVKPTVANTEKTGSSSCAANDITVTGTITYDLVAHNTGTNGLDYGAITQEPVKGALVESICNSGVYDSAVTNVDGTYSITASANLDNTIRVYAQMTDTTAPGTWNFKVVDNTSSSALYAMNGTTINSGANVTNHNLNASSGWGGSSYNTTRVAAPFAILDSVYTSFQKVLSVDANAVFPALNINWSINNVATSGNKAIGQITTSHFDGSAIYILGAENSDTDEYDDHVIIHEWGHYFEHNFSRSDSIGGSHGTGNILDIRLAFGEGFGNAYSGIASGDSNYRDSTGNQQSSGFGFDVNSNSCTNAGWYSECSVQALLYDFNTQISFSALYTVLTNSQKNTSSVTSIFSFVKALKDNNAGSVSAINTLLTGQSIDSITDIYGDSELSNNPGNLDQLPVHSQL